jgi:hypothetical protein
VQGPKRNLIQDMHVEAAAAAAGSSALPAKKQMRGFLQPRSPYGDEKNANRDIRVWHGATEKGP